MIQSLVNLIILNQREEYMPGDRLECEYRLQLVDEDDLQAIETSVLWYTEGKGEEDIGVHFFRRRQRREMAEGDLSRIHRFSVVLPQTPLSYDGQMVRIHWCVRVKLFFGRGKQKMFDRPFRLGNALPPDSLSETGS